MFFTNLPFYSTAIVKKNWKNYKIAISQRNSKITNDYFYIDLSFPFNIYIYIYIVSWRLTNLYLKGADLNYFNECVIAVSCMKKIFEYKIIIIISKLLKTF
jgi:hypothetical protein